MTRIATLHGQVCRDPWNKPTQLALADELAELLGNQVIALQLVVDTVCIAKRRANNRALNAHLRLNAIAKRRARS